MATIIDALAVTLGLDSHEFKEGIQDAKESIESLAVSIGGAFAVFEGLGALKEFMHSTMESRAELEDLGKRIGVATEELQTWQNMAIIATGSASGLNSSLESLNGMVALLGGPLAKRAVRRMQNFSPAFTEAALKGKDTMAVFNMVIAAADKMQAGGMATNTIAAKMMRLGISKDVVDMWIKGGDEIAEFRKKAQALGTTSAENLEAAEKQEQSLNLLNLTLKKAAGTIYDMLAPAIKWLTDALNQLAMWAKAHPMVIRAAFIGIAAGVAVLTAALLVMNAALWANPIVWIVAAVIVAVGLLAYGILWLISKWKEWDAAGRETFSFFGKFFAFITAAWGAIKDAVVQTFMSIWDIIKDYVQLIKDEFELVVAIFSGDGDRIKEAWNKLCEHLGEFISTAFKFVILEVLLAVKALYDMWAGWFGWMEKKVEALAHKIARKLVVKVAGEEAGKKYDEGVKQVDAMKAKPMKEQLAIGWADIKSKVALGKDVMTGNYAAGMKKYEASQKTITTSIGTVNVNAPNATDAKGVAAGAQAAFQEHPLVAQAEAH